MELLESLRAGLDAALASDGGSPGAYVDAWLASHGALKLDRPAMVGYVRFGRGVSWATVVKADQRRYESEVTPEKEAERIDRAQEALSALQEDLGVGSGETIMAEQQSVAWAVSYDGVNPSHSARSGPWGELEAKFEAARIGGTARAIPVCTLPPREELPRCPRCMKIISGEGVHTCTPTAGWRQLEKQNEELRGALERLRGSFQFGEFDGVSPEGCERAMKFIDAAIASVKGGA